MMPQALCSALLDLEPGLEIMTGHKNVQNPDEVEFAVVWNHPEGLLMNYPNLRAISFKVFGLLNILGPAGFFPILPSLPYPQEPS